MKFTYAHLQCYAGETQVIKMLFHKATVKTEITTASDALGSEDNKCK